jgi:hypothetical protein
MKTLCTAGCAAAFVAAAAIPVHGEWTAAAYLGASATAAAALTLDRPSAGVHLEWKHVPFESRSFASPPYYGYRLRWTPSREARAGVEAELIHLKVYARAGSLAPAVERFSISHGLNLILGNIVWRQPLGRGVRLAARAGAGVVVPHAESRVGGVDQEQYEISSAALQGAAGPEFAPTRHARAFVEYKVTTAAPTVGVAGGTIRGRYTSQHLAAGLGVAW